MGHADSTPFESAQLILNLYELRRDPVLREARAWFLREFNPSSSAELLALAGGRRNPWFRMVLGYWDMAASLVTFGAIDAEMFRAANTDMVATFAKVEPYLGELRAASGIPEFLQHVEAVVRGMPGAGERMAMLREQFHKATARRRRASEKRKKPAKAALQRKAPRLERGAAAEQRLSGLATAKARDATALSKSAGTAGIMW